MGQIPEIKPQAPELMAMGVLKVREPYTRKQIQSWNERLDPLFKEREGNLPRAYVNCDELEMLGILSEVLSPEMRALLRELLPDGVVYHCLSSEIPAGQRNPHVSAGDPGGWHQDSDALSTLDPLEPHYLSLMIYLSDVPSEEFGAFEAVIYPEKGIDGSLCSELIVGVAGTTWWFNRATPHRVRPNSSNCRRRLLKLSFQHASAPNHHVTEPEFRTVLAAARERGDDFLAALFGANIHSASIEHRLPHVPALLPLLESARPNSTLHISKREQARAFWERARNKRWGISPSRRLTRKVARRLRRLPRN